MKKMENDPDMLEEYDFTGGVRGKYAEAMGVEARTARRHLGHFEELGLVRKTGSGPSQRYEVT